MQTKIALLSCGKLVKEYRHVHPPTFTFNTNEMKNGLYLLQIYDQEKSSGILSLE